MVPLRPSQHLVFHLEIEGMYTFGMCTRDVLTRVSDHFKSSEAPRNELLGATMNHEAAERHRTLEVELSKYKDVLAVASSIQL